MLNEQRCSYREYGLELLKDLPLCRRELESLETCASRGIVVARFGQEVQWTTQLHRAIKHHRDTVPPSGNCADDLQWFHALLAAQVCKVSGECRTVEYTLCKILNLRVNWVVGLE